LKPRLDRTCELSFGLAHISESATISSLLEETEATFAASKKNS